MKFSKKKLSFLILGLTGVGTITTTSLLLSSCSSSSNPFYPNTELTVNINNQQLKFSFDTTSKNFYYIDASGNKSTLNDLLKNVFEFKDANSNSITIKPGMVENADYNAAVSLANNAYISSQVMSYLLSFIENGLKVLLNSPVFTQVLDAQTSFNVSDWSNKFATNEIAKEFSYGYTSSAGEGSTIFSIGPKKLDLSLEIVDTSTNAPSTNPVFKPGQIANNDPNMDSKTIKIKSFNVDFSWYKHLRTGGEWVTDISLVNKNLSSSQLSYIQEKIYNNDKTKTGFQNLDYKLSFDTTNPNILPQFNFLPNIIEYKDPSTSVVSKVFNGIGSIIQPNIKDTKGNYVPDEKQSPYTLFGLNYEQTLQLIGNLNNFLKSSIHNNINDVLYNAYCWIYSIGFYSINPKSTKTDLDNSISTNISKYKSKFVLNSNINEWTTLKKDVNYTKGIELIYYYFKLNQQPI